MGTIPAALEIVPQSIMSIATRRASAAVLSSEPVTHSRANFRPLTANGLPSRRLILARHSPRLISNALMTNCRYSIPHPQARHVYAIRRKGQQRGATVMSSWREIPSLRQAEHALKGQHHLQRHGDVDGVAAARRRVEHRRQRGSGG